MSVRDELRASQRGRLFCAVADSVAAKGYAATSVADVISLASVSRTTLYEHSVDAEACFPVAYDSGAQVIYEAMVAANAVASSAPARTRVRSCER
jgi:hypothetical protein